MHTIFLSLAVFYVLYYPYFFQKGNDGNSNELGYNIVGLIPGQFYNTSKDRILFVGAHWDTYGLSPGFDDNGSGVAAVLEAARVLAAASCYRVSEIKEWKNNSKKIVTSMLLLLYRQNSDKRGL